MVPLKTRQDSRAIFNRLKKILLPYAKHFTVAKDETGAYALVAPFKQNPAKRFAGIAIRQKHVTFYLCPDILKDASPLVKQKIRGVASVQVDLFDDALFVELERLTAQRFRNFQAGSW